MAWHPLRGEPDSGEMGTVYLLHLSAPFGHARHYLGWASKDSLEARLAHHAAGTGANMLRHAKAAGITFELVRTWPGDRNRERQLKNRSHTNKLCPVWLRNSGRAEQGGTARHLHRNGNHDHCHYR